MSAVAPAAPGRLGEPIEPQPLLTYLTELGGWLTGRRAELDQLDAAVRASEHAAELTGDIRLGLTLWQAIRSRYDAMLRTWDSGRVGPAERETLSRQIWGRLDGAVAAAGGLSGLSVPEAGQLSDALTAQLRQRLQLDPGGSAALTRIRDLRAQLERLRDQVALEPADQRDRAERTRDALAVRVQTVADKASRGGDVGGLLGPLESDAALFERDLIVGGALRRQHAGRIAELAALRQRLADREPELAALVARTVAALTPAPRYAVPDVSRLELPAPDGLEAYAARLGQVAQAMDLVESAYGGALAELDRLRADLDALGPRDATLAALTAAAHDVLGRTPVPMDAARSLVGACREYADRLPAEPSGGQG